MLRMETIQMTRIFKLAFGLAMLAAMANAEPYFVSISATVAAATTTFGRPGESVVICNDSASANIAYFRLFDDTETPAAATTSSSSLAVGVCITYPKSALQPGFWKAINTVSAGTSTVRVYVN